MEQKPDPSDFPDGNAVLAMLGMAKEAERRKPRRPLAVRARALAERYLDQLEADPERDVEQLAWVLKLLEAARAEEAMEKTRAAPKPVREPRTPYPRRTETEPSPHASGGGPNRVEAAGSAAPSPERVCSWVPGSRLRRAPE